MQKDPAVKQRLSKIIGSINKRNFGEKYMKKIGICTLYYKNRNYGANLQAYALQQTIKSLGCDAYLIPYYHGTRSRRILSELRQRLLFNKVKEIGERNLAVDKFNAAIPHSRLYYSTTIRAANKDFDGFIVGSDQVWNPDWINPYMSLEFVEKSKMTASYAASIGRTKLNDEEKRKVDVALKNTRHISIREKESIPALRELTEKEIEWVLDPTLLLSTEEWNKICTKRIVKDNYIFCYFLGGNENLRNVATEYAKKRDLKIVTLPYLNAKYRKVDDGFGNEQLYNVSPEEFLSLVKYSSFVITDSFHAAVFSHIYEREFVVAGNKDSEMGCRMESLATLFGTEKRYFCDFSMLSSEILCNLEDYKMDFDYEKYERMKEKSIEFLKKVIQSV